MPIVFHCEGCGAGIRTKDENAGKESKCPGCGASLTVPGGYTLAGPTPKRPKRPLPIPPEIVPQAKATAPAPATEPEPEPEKTPASPASSRPVWLIPVIAASCFVGLIGIGVAAMFVFNREEPSIAAKVEPKSVDPPPLSTEQLVLKVEKSVAQVRGKSHTGTGFIILPGIVATNAHVIRAEPPQEIEVRFPSAHGADVGPVPGHVVYFDDRRDLALLRVSTRIPPLEVAPEGPFRRGRDVTIIGCPGAGNMILQNAITRGVLSTRIQMNGLRFDQLGAAINQGNSGGPVFDEHGRVLGVATLKTKDEEAVGFCIPADDVRDALAKFQAQAPSEEAQAAARHRLGAIISDEGELLRFLASNEPGFLLASFDASSTLSRDDPRIAEYDALLSRAAQQYGQTEKDVMLQLFISIISMRTEDHLSVSYREALEYLVKRANMTPGVHYESAMATFRAVHGGRPPQNNVQVSQVAPPVQQQPRFQMGGEQRPNIPAPAQPAPAQPDPDQPPHGSYTGTYGEPFNAVVGITVSMGHGNEPTPPFTTKPGILTVVAGSRVTAQRIAVDGAAMYLVRASGGRNVILTPEYFDSHFDREESKKKNKRRVR